MVDYTHYDGGRSEEAVVSAISHLLNDDEADTVKKIKNVYWRIGEIIEIAVAERFHAGAGIEGLVFLEVRQERDPCAGLPEGVAMPSRLRSRL